MKAGNRKYFKHASADDATNIFYRRVYTVGNSKGITLTKLIDGWNLVRVKIVNKKNDSITLCLEKME